jgi:L-asparaginase
MRTIYVITTGGTIEKDYSEHLGIVANLEGKMDKFLAHLRLPNTSLQVVPLMNKDSLDFTSVDRSDLLAKVTELLSTKCPIVITHGTDTMVTSGVLIEESFPKLEVPIVLTGAMTPLGFDRSDGLQNLTESLLATQLIDPGVYVVMHGQVFSVSQTRKDPKRKTFVRIEETSELMKAESD